MASTGITNDYYLNTSKYKYTTEKDNSSLGKDAFMQILIAQLQNQDPTSPMDDKEFIAQMAQFSSLEQMHNMTKAMENLLTSQQQTQLMAYTNFIGKEVKWHEVTDKKDEKGNAIVQEGQGVIKELKFKDDQPIFILDSGKEIGAGNISSILSNSSSTDSVATATSNLFAQASELIGKQAQYTDDNGDLVQSIIEAITKKNDTIQYVLANGERFTKDQFKVVSSNSNE